MIKKNWIDVKVIFEQHWFRFRKRRERRRGWLEGTRKRLGREERADKTMHRVLRLRGGSAEPPQIQVSLQFTARCRFRRIDMI